MNFILELFFIFILLLNCFNFPNNYLGFMLEYLKVNNDISFYKESIIEMKI